MLRLIIGVLVNKLICILSLILGKKISKKLRISRDLMMKILFIFIVILFVKIELKLIQKIILFLDAYLSIGIIYIFRNANIIGITGTIGSGKTTLIK